MSSCIELAGVTKRYADFCLDIESASIAAGKITGLVGRNGAGKTTLIDLVVGLRSPSSGSIMVLGTENLQDKALKERIGFVVENTAFHDCLSPADIDRVYRRIYRRWGSTAFHGFLERFEIRPQGRFAGCSKGTRTKLLLATALAHDPDLLILDEPTSGLDPVARREVLGIVRQASGRNGRSILFSTHIVSDLSESADEMLVLRSGRVAFHGTVSALEDEGAKHVDGAEGTVEGASAFNEAVVNLMSDGKGGAR